jgi:hypothetical protein
MNDIDCDPEQMLDDTGYDSEAVRRDIEQRGGDRDPKLGQPENTACGRQGRLRPA